MLRSSVSDILSGVKPGERKRWRFEDEVPVGSKKPVYVPFSKNARVRKGIAAYFNLKSTGEISPDGYRLKGYRQRKWRRPFVIMDSKGKFKFSSENGIRNHWKKPDTKQ